MFYKRIAPIQEPHEQAFLMDLLVYSCQDDLMCLENKIQKQQKKLKNKKTQKRLLMQNTDKKKIRISITKLDSKTNHDIHVSISSTNI
jgi:hypothetical protein